MFVNEFGNSGRSIVNLYSVCFYVHLTVNGKRTAHEPLATTAKRFKNRGSVAMCREINFSVVLRVPVSRGMSVV